MKKKILTAIIIVAILLISVSIFYYLVIFLPQNHREIIELQSQKEQDKMRQNKIGQEEITKYQVELFYNKATGELYPSLPEDVNPHTCVWTIWGDHGSEIKLATDSLWISEETDPKIKLNKFLPPRVPIYVTCIDWQNYAYQGVIEDYK